MLVQKLKTAALVTTAALSTVFPRTAPAAERPNIIFVLADDLGPDGFGCYGSMNFSNCTPRIDQLATNGMRFTHAYCTALCSPTRAQYLTGQYPFRNGVLDIDGSNYLDDTNKPNLTQVLQQAGYTTGGTGKSVRDDWARTCYMDEYINRETGDYTNVTVSKRGPTTINATNYPYFPDAMQAFAFDFLDRNRPQASNSYKPFYFFYSLPNPHVPIERTPDSAPGETNLVALYLDNIEYIDKMVGNIVDKLSALGILDNTLILVAGDNGSLSNYQSKLWDQKTSTYRKIDGAKADRTDNREGTALIPLIAYWPAVITSPSVVTSLVDFTDMLPTYADVAGGSIPTNWILDGKSFAPFLRNSPNPESREWIYHQIQNNWCVRSMDYRLNRDGRFFDMSDAPFSMTVISNPTPQQETVRAALQAVLDDFDPSNGPTYESHQDNLYNVTVWNWKKAYFSSSERWETVYSGDNSDPDGDGVPNIYERAFGWNPKVGTNAMPKIIYNGTTLSVTYPLAGSTSDVQVVVDATSNLTTTWDSSTATIGTTGSNPLTSVDLITNETSRFMRFRTSRVTPWPEP